MLLRKLLAAALPLAAMAATVAVAQAISVPPPTPVPIRCPPPSPSPTPPTLSATGPTPTASGATPTASPSPTPPPTAPPNCITETPSPFPTVLHTPAPSLTPPSIHAASAILEDLGTGQVLFSFHADDRRPIASVTKLMTALLVLTHSKPGDVVTVGADAAAEGRAGPGVSNLGLRDGERLSVDELLYALLLQSSNDAAIALADHVSGDEGAFVVAMNHEAAALGLKRTRFASSSGLDDSGFSTARNIAAIAERDFRNPTFARIVATKFHDIPAPFGPSRRVQNRNVLLWLYPGALGGKTGFTSRAGFCLVAAARRDGRAVITVVLGDVSEDASFDDGAALLDYGFHAFTRKRLVTAGSKLHAVPVGTRWLPIEAGSGLTRLIPVTQANHASSRVRILPGLHLPLAKGKPVGTVSVTAEGHLLGTVPAVVAGPPFGVLARVSGQTPGRPPPWWERGISAAGSFTLHAFLSLFG